MEETVKIEGLRELREALLRTIPAELQGKTLQKALGAGTALVVRDAKARAPVDTGRLRKAIYAVRNKQNSNGVFEERVVTVRRGKKFQKTSRDAYYWKFVEFGHRTGAGKGKYLKKVDRPGGRGVVSTGVVPAKPFLRPAFESQKRPALEAITKRLGAEIEKAAAKARKR